MVGDATRRDVDGGSHGCVAVGDDGVVTRGEVGEQVAAHLVGEGARGHLPGVVEQCHLAVPHGGPGAGGAVGDHAGEFGCGAQHGGDLAVGEVHGLGDRIAACSGDDDGESVVAEPADLPVAGTVGDRGRHDLTGAVGDGDGRAGDRLAGGRGGHDAREGPHRREDDLGVDRGGPHGDGDRGRLVAGRRDGEHVVAGAGDPHTEGAVGTGDGTGGLAAAGIDDGDGGIGDRAAVRAVDHALDQADNRVAATRIVEA